MDLGLKLVDRNSPKKHVAPEELKDNKITSFNLNFDGFFILSFKTHMEVFSFRHDLGKVSMKKEVEYIGEDT
jgi:hypothetical protein